MGQRREHPCAPEPAPRGGPTPVPGSNERQSSAESQEALVHTVPEGSDDRQAVAEPRQDAGVGCRLPCGGARADHHPAAAEPGRHRGPTATAQRYPRWGVANGGRDGSGGTLKYALLGGWGAFATRVKVGLCRSEANDARGSLV